MNEKLLVMGIGNPLLQDDRAGIEVCERLEAMGADVDVEILYTVGFEVLDKLADRKRAVIVDACLLYNKPGTVLNVKVDDIFTNASLTNSHAITLGTTLKLGLQLFPEDMPEELDIILIEAKEPDKFSKECSPEVEQAIAQVVDGLLARIGNTAA